MHAAAQRCGVTLHDDAYGTQSRVEPPAASPHGASPRDGALAWLAGQSLLRLDGDDALRFVQSQTTNDVLQQASDVARWHGYCSPKGRLLATMLAWRDGGSIRLMLPDSVAEPIRKRLTMFVLRSKVRITNESGAFVVFGVAGDAAIEALARLRSKAPAPMRVAVAEVGAGTPASGDDGSGASRLTAIGLPALPAHALAGAGGDAPRWLLVLPVASAESAWNALRATLVPLDSDAWRWTDVRSGIASVVAPTSERFVPQMLNLEADAIGAVSFTKGCYPGQEVVARSHYLGKTKRRTFLARISSSSSVPAREPAPGSDVVDASGRPVGVVVAAASSPDGAIDVLFEAQVAAAEEGALAVDGQALQPLALPYSLPSE
ncbi:MAG TPA: folate-binding protein [Zeimonas sp.]